MAIVGAPREEPPKKRAAAHIGLTGRIRTLLRATKSKYATFQVLLIEVALIVVSVLLALAVDNWNAGRQDRRLEQRMLQQLRNSLTAELSGLTEFRRSVEVR